MSWSLCECTYPVCERSKEGLPIGSRNLAVCDETGKTVCVVGCRAAEAIAFEKIIGYDYTDDIWGITYNLASHINQSAIDLNTGETNCDLSGIKWGIKEMVKRYLDELTGTYEHSHQKCMEQLLLEREGPNISQEQLSNLLIEKQRRAQDTLNSLRF